MKKNYGFLMRIWTLLFVLLLPVAVSAQGFGKPVLDSLLKVLPTLQENKSRVDALVRISSAYSRIDARKGIVAGLEAEVLAKRLNWPRGIATSLNSLGLCYTSNVEYAKALACYDTMTIVSQKDGYKEGILLSLMNIAVVYNEQGYYSRAVDWLMRSLKVAEEIHDSVNISLNLANIGSIYSKLQDYEKALEYGLQAYAYYRRSGNRVMEAIVTGGLGDVYDGLHQRDKALDYYARALALLRQLGDRAGLVVNLANRAITYSENKEYERSITDFLEAARLADSLGDSYRLASLLAEFAHTYINAAQAVSGELPGKRAYYLQEARKTLSQAFAINEKNGNLDALADNYKYIALLDSVNGNYKEALVAYEKYKDFYDSIFTANNQKTIQKLEDQRQIDLRDKEIQINQLDLHNQRNQRWFFIGGLLALFLVGALLFIQSRQRKKANLELRSLNVQLGEANRWKAKLFGIIGHDLRSPVANLINFLHLRNMAPDLSGESLEGHEKNIAARAENLLHTMEDLLFWSKGQMANFSPQKKTLAVDDLFAEMRLLYPDEERLQIRFVNPDRLELFTDGDYLKTILRNLTTNAIKAVKEQPVGIIVWRAWEESGRTYLSVADNGPGLPEAGQRVLVDEDAVVGGTSGLGLHLVRDLAAAIGMAIKVQSQPGAGTVFTLHLM
jgi:signal transduction histidine kinase